MLWYLRKLKNMVDKKEKLSSVKKWDLFEDQSYNLIINAINKWELAIPFTNIKIFKKKKYYSKEREKDIIFDLAIELWPKDATKYSILYLIECKNYGTKKVQVWDIESFESKIQQVAKHNWKWIFISNSWYQSSALKILDNMWIMTFDVKSNEKYDIIFYKSKKGVSVEDNIITKFLVEAFSIDIKIYWLKFLKKDDLEKISLKFLEWINWTFWENNDKISLEDILLFLKIKYNLKIVYKKLEDDILWFWNLTKNIIYINEFIKEKKEHNFVLAHEISHFLLHKNLKKNNLPLEIFKDTEDNLFSWKRKLKNDLDWIEWQANYFAGCLLLPKKTLHIHLMLIQEEIWINWIWHIYVDNQKCNKIDYKRIMDYLSNYFEVSKLSLKFRLKDLWYLEFSDDYNDNSTWFSNLLK